MKRFKRLLPPVLMLLVAACSDTTGPLTQDFDNDVPELDARKGKGGNTGGDNHDATGYVLRQSPTAPPLETYLVSFWAVKGQGSQVQVNYVGAGKADGRRFLKFHVPARGLAARPDGSSIATGDSVLITATIDPVDFNVRFAPSGLRFSRKHPATLTLKYVNVDEDVDRDGDVDANDSAILQNGISFFHYADGQTSWDQLSSTNDFSLKKIQVKVPHFSGYAVSW